jgi:DDE family transposase
MKTYARQALTQSFLTQAERYGKAVRTFSPQDHAAKKPLRALAAYSGTTVSQVPPHWAALTRALLGRAFLMVADKAWYCGPLLQDLHAQ